MKKIFRLILCLVVVACLVTPSMAAEAEIIFTADSVFEAGGTVTVDQDLTAESVYYYCSEDLVMAMLEGNVQYYWMRNDSYYADGISLTLTEEDKGCQFYCVAALYGDADRTQQIGSLRSKTFSVPDTGNPALIPEITTKLISNGVVGEQYYQKLECTDPDVTYSLFRSSLPDGLTLTQHGEIEGIPTKAGFWYVVIMATPEFGAEYATTMEYELYIYEPGPQYSMEIMRLPQKITYTAGEKLDMKGLWVRIYTPEGYLDSYDGKYLTYSQKALVTLGEQKIKLAYEDAMEIFIVTVEPAPTEAPTEAPSEATEPPTEEPTEPVEETMSPEAPTQDTETEPTTAQNSTITTGQVTENKKPTQKAPDNGGNNTLVVILIVVIGIMGAGVGVLSVLLLKKKSR